jgi:hypothetical protein
MRLIQMSHTARIPCITTLVHVCTRTLHVHSWKEIGCRFDTHSTLYCTVYTYSRRFFLLLPFISKLLGCSCGDNSFPTPSLFTGTGTVHPRQSNTTSTTHIPQAITCFLLILTTVCPSTSWSRAPQHRLASCGLILWFRNRESSLIWI